MDARAPSSTAREIHIPSVHPPFSPRSRSSDFPRPSPNQQKLSTQSSPSRNMVAAPINVTRLHPTGVQYVPWLPNVPSFHCPICISSLCMTIWSLTSLCCPWVSAIMSSNMPWRICRLLIDSVYLNHSFYDTYFLRHTFFSNKRNLLACSF
jgi:hypothetical protein